MPFGINQNIYQNRTTTPTTTTTNNTSILAQTLFNTSAIDTTPNMIINDNYSTNNKQTVTQSAATNAASATTTTTQAASNSCEALIVQSNSGVVSDEILLQLQEQVGEGKQIYVLNSEDDDTNVQYLIVDKDADISAILQDPSIFQQTTTTTNLNDDHLKIQQQQQQQQQQYIIVQNDLLNVNQIINETNINGNHSLIQNNNLQQQQSIIHHQQQHHNNHQQHHQPIQQQQQQHHHTVQHHHHHHQQQQHHSVNKLNHKASSFNSNSTYTQIQSLASIEESIQRVSGPLPKRRTFEFQLENRKYSYQDAFLKFLAGEKQPSLDIISEQINRKPKDNVYISNKNKPTISGGNTTNGILTNTSSTATLGTSTSSTASSSTSSLNLQSNSSVTTTSATTTTTATTGTPTTSYVDKENYYNASRRENLLPLNNYEYRNSYKDHYDHQGVRVNPAILKALPPELQQTINNQQQQVISASNVTTRNSSIVITPAQTTTTTTTVASQNKSNIINDVSQLLNYPQNSIADTNTLANGTENIDLDLLAKENVLLSAKAASIDHTYKIKQTPQQSTSITQVESQAKSNNIINNNNARKRTKTNSTTDSSGDEEKFKKKFKKTNSIIGQEIKLEEETQNQIQHEQQQQQAQEVTAVQHDLILPDDKQTQEQIEQQTNQEINNLDFEVTFIPGEFLIHKSTFSDYDSYDIWCVRDDGYLQKYEPVYLSTGERCHQSADVLAQYTPDKSEFILVKVDEKGKTEQNNIVVCVLPEYEPKNNPNIQINQQQIQNDEIINTQVDTQDQQNSTEDEVNNKNDKNQVKLINNVVTYDELKPTFDVFSQILLSQVINSEFLFKIKDIQDDYFKPVLGLIDTLINEKYQIICEHAKFNDEFKLALNEKPKILIEKLNETNKEQKCQAFQDAELGDNVAEFVVKLFGVNYNPETLSPIDEKDLGSEKNFYVCSKASKLSEISHSIKHLKIYLYDICSQRVEQVRQELNDNETDALSHCLDDQFLTEIFENFKKILTDVDDYITNNIGVNLITTAITTTTPTTADATNQNMVNDSIVDQLADINSNTEILESPPESMNIDTIKNQ